MTSVNYNLLFTIELLHKFFANGQCTDFNIVASPQTASLIKGNKIVTRQYDNKLYAAIEADAGGNISLLPAEAAAFTFFLQLTRPVFFNYTHLPSSLSTNSVYYFTNRNNNPGNGKTFLSQLIPYSNTTTYKPGEIAVSVAGIAFRALRTLTNVTPVAGSDWMEIDANRYLTDKDILLVLPSKSVYNFAAPQSSAAIQVHGFNAASPADYNTLVLSKTVPFVNPVSSFTLNLGELSPGKYKVKVNSDAERIVYINDELNIAQTFAVIDLYNDSTLPSGYKMLNGSALLSPAYSLSFLNRATIWKYSLMSASGTISDNAGVFHFSSPAPHIVSSLLPIPLTEKSLNLKLNVGALEYTPIACASPQRLSKVTTPTDVYDCSEIFLNY